MSRPAAIYPTTDAKRRPSTASVRDSEQPPRIGGLLGALIRIRTFEALQFRDYRLLWLGNATTSLGQWMDQVARGWLMYQLTNSPFDLGLSSAVRALPLLFFSLVAGVVADRGSRKAQLILSQLTNAGTEAVLGVLALTGHVQPWHIYATALLAGSVQAFQQPARQAMLSDIVERPYIPNALGLNAMIFNAARSAGPATAGLVIAVSNVGICYLVQAALYLAATVWTIQMHEHKSHLDQSPTSGRERRSFSQSTRDGFRFIRGDKTIGTVMLIVLIPSVLGQPYTSLMPVFARDILQVGPTGQGLLLTAVGLGALVGAVTVATVGNTGKQGLLMLLGATVFGFTLVGFSASLWFGVSLGLMAVSGLCNVSYGTQANSLLQMHTPQELRGRVMGVYYLNRGLVPIGSLLAGSLATVLGAQRTVFLMGGTCGLLALWFLLTSPRIRGLR